MGSVDDLTGTVFFEFAAGTEAPSHANGGDVTVSGSLHIYARIADIEGVFRSDAGFVDDSMHDRRVGFHRYILLLSGDDGE